MYILQNEVIYRYFQVRWDRYSQKKISVLILSTTTTKKHIYFFLLVISASNHRFLWSSSGHIFCFILSVSYFLLFSSEVGTEKWASVNIGNPFSISVTNMISKDGNMSCTL